MSESPLPKEGQIGQPHRYEHPPGVEQETENSFGIIMIKPHAFAEAADVVVRGLFDSPDSERWEHLGLSQEMLERLERLKVCKTLIMDLSDDSDDAGRLLEIFYGEDQNKRHYSLLLETYKAGPVMIILLGYEGSQSELHELLHELKGREILLDSKGKKEQEGSGLRGTLIKPREAINLEDLDRLEEEEYRALAIQMINNVVHTTTSRHKIAGAMRIVLKGTDIKEMEARGIKIKNFMDQYAPRDLI